jgi:hypothetical protein
MDVHDSGRRAFASGSSGLTGEMTMPGNGQTAFETPRDRGEGRWAGNSVLRSLRGSLITAGILLVLDVLIFGSFTISFFVGPIWLLVAVAKAVFQRKNRPLAAKRIGIVLVTLALVFGNAWLEARMARANAELIIEACTRYQTDKGIYPTKLDDLVPMYLHSVPRAKYDLFAGDFFYLTYKGQHSLMWVAIPPFGRPDYQFEKAKWGYLD